MSRTDESLAKIGHLEYQYIFLVKKKFLFALVIENKPVPCLKV